MRERRALLHLAVVALLEFSGLAYGFSDELVIVEATGALHAGNVIGLVGTNGGGKTTLLRLLLGELGPEDGRVQRAKGARIAYVSQAAVGDDDDALFDFAAAGRADLVELDALHDRLAAELELHPADGALAARLGEVQMRFAALGGHIWQHELERLLLGLSFSREEFTQPLSSLSGGQRQKACLARALISGSNCLVLDEPTNHLDLDAQAFLAGYIRGLPAECAVLLVSHDRWLLDAACTHIWELDDGVLHRYVGNYSRYWPARELRRKQADEEYKRQQEYVARTEEYIRRNIAGQNTKQARGRRTLLSRMQRVERPAEDPQLSFVLKPTLTTGEQLLLVENLAFGYGPGGAGRETAPTYVPAGPRGLNLNPQLSIERSAVSEGLLLEGLNFAIYRGERLGIIGHNGCGKSTLLKLLSRELPPWRGLVAWGANAELGIFSQDSADLLPGRDVLAELRSVDPAISDGDARSYLARFGFSGDDAFKLVESLSGGERSRLSLAKIFRRRPNVLLLDEPTNHLDIYAREALEQFLAEYQGSVLMVTHDRALLERTCNRLVLFERAVPPALDTPGGKGEQAERGITFFRGRYSEYVAWRDQQAASAWRQASPPAGSAAKGPQAETPAATRGMPASPEGISIDDLEELARVQHMSAETYCQRMQRRAQRQVEQMESAIAGFEAQVLQLRREQHDADRAGDYTRIANLQQRIDAVRPEIEAIYNELEQALAVADAWGGLGQQAAEYNPRR